MAKEHLKITTATIEATYIYPRLHRHNFKEIRKNFKQPSDYSEINASDLGIEDSYLPEVLKQLEGCETLTTLSLKKNKITSKGIKAITSFAKKTPSLTKLDLSNNKLDKSGADALLHYIQKYESNLTEVHLEKNNIDPIILKQIHNALEGKKLQKRRGSIETVAIAEKGKESVEAPIQTFPNRIVITKQDISYEKKVIGLHKLALKLKEPDCNIESLTIHDDSFSDTEIMFLCNGLVSNRSLTNLNLSNCNITFEGARVLSETLKENKFSKISSINLEGNRINGTAKDINTVQKLNEFVDKKLERKRVPVPPLIPVPEIAKENTKEPSVGLLIPVTEDVKENNKPKEPPVEIITLYEYDKEPEDGIRKEVKEPVGISPKSQARHIESEQQEPLTKQAVVIDSEFKTRVENIISKQSNEISSRSKTESSSWVSKVGSPSVKEKLHKEKVGAKKIYPFITPFLKDEKVLNNKGLKDKMAEIGGAIARGDAIEKQDTLYKELKTLANEAGVTKFNVLKVLQKTSDNKVTDILFSHPADKDITIRCVMDEKGERIIKLDKNGFNDTLFIIGQPNKDIGISSICIMAGKEESVLQSKKHNFSVGEIEPELFDFSPQEKKCFSFL
ncbi:MAG: uncharacterized protein K0R98_1478 [Rickettsiaceae bacterium]|jgi:Ran GTPase-activating protein (RanGAP) involved in mRNA processing and transport|nr:uncharacterized protein [Rickettsiaceae bacterium]